MSDHIAVWGNDVNGLMAGPVLWTGKTTTTGGGWSVDYTGAEFIEPPIVVATLLLNDADVYDRGFASLSAAPTTTSASGYGVRGANLALLGATTRTVPDGTVVHVMALGETFNDE
jgi:hypothetical protein